MPPDCCVLGVGGLSWFSDNCLFLFLFLFLFSFLVQLLLRPCAVLAEGLLRLAAGLNSGVSCDLLLDVGAWPLQGATILSPAITDQAPQLQETPAVVGSVKQS